ncbi:MAG: carboxypeptidase regulatory-like domain-containing protein [Bacteroidota bacterium]
MKKLYIVLLFVSICGMANAQGTLKGKITDGKEPIPYANIIIVQGGKQFGGAQSDMDGNYTIKPIPPGRYDIKASFVGYAKVTITDVQISNDRITYLDIQLVAKTEKLSAVEVRWTKPLIVKDASASTVTMSSSEISIMPGRSAAAVGTSMAGYASTSRAADGSSSKGDKMFSAIAVPVDPKFAHLLTAGEVNDFTKWVLWNDISKKELYNYAKDWNLLPQHRFCVQLINEASNPVVDASVTLLDKNKKVVWETKTDNTGKAEMWSKLFTSVSIDIGKYSIEIKYLGEKHTITKAIPFSKGVNILKLPVACNYSNNVDVMFVVDETGSMADEIKYLKAELLDIITNVKKRDSSLAINLGSVFYRDKGDSYLTQTSDFSSDILKTIDFINKQDAGGGGDYEEAVEEALDQAITKCNWSADARTRILFLVLDAPPHAKPEVITKLSTLITLAAEKGIRIIPITCSGVSKSTEYLLRSMALSTNGTYTFLTDDSGIGDSHIKPTTDSYKVELLNDLIIRLFTQYTTIPICNKPIVFSPAELIPDTSFLAIQPDTLKSADTTRTEVKPKVEVKPLWKCFPNPTGGALTVEITGSIVDLFITDNAGKILEKVATSNTTSIYNLDLSNYPNGIYFLRYYYGKDQSVTAKIILTR